MPIQRSKILALALAAALLAVLVVVAATAVLDRIFPFSPMPFDSDVWKATPSEFSLDSVRLRMVDDLLATRPLVGRHRDDIVAWIGEPDDTVYFHEYSMVYHLGLERSFIAIDSEWLVIQLNDVDVATECRLSTD